MPQYDYLGIGGVVHRALFGLAVYPHPEERSTRHLRLKSELG